jgi:small nuclear ribonucleoprotein (snRNP)-like protein
MMKKSRMVGFVGSALAILFAVTIFMPPAETQAKSEVVAVQGVSYNVNSSLADNLKSLVGKKVYVSLDSGQTFIGFVKEVGNHLVHLEKLEGKDYFDALLQIENIIAIDTRFREVQR